MKWEYKVARVKPKLISTDKKHIECLQKVCDEFGKDGWELVNFQCYDLSTTYTLIFKKPVK